MRIRILILLTVTLVVLTGCAGSVSFGRRTLAADRLERRIVPLVERELGTAPDSITCDDLDAEVGATSTCSARVGGRDLDLTVMTTAVDGLDLRFHVEGVGPGTISAGTADGPGGRAGVAIAPEQRTGRSRSGGSGSSRPAGTTPGATQPSTAPGTGAPVVPTDELEAQLAAGLRAQVGQAPPPITCTEPLDGVVGARGRCTLLDGRDRFEITLEVTSVDGTDVGFDFVVADRPS